MVAGTGPNDHVGRSITLKSLHFRWQGALAPTTTGSSPLRLLIVYDKQSNATAATAIQVLLADGIEYPMNLNNNRRFTILMNEEIPCVGTAGPQAWSVERFRKLNHNVEFNQVNGGTFLDITSGNVWMFVYSLGVFGIANPFSVVQTRLRYVDA